MRITPEERAELYAQLREPWGTGEFTPNDIPEHDARAMNFTQKLKKTISTPADMLKLFFTKKVIHDIITETNTKGERPFGMQYLLTSLTNS